MFVWLIGDLTDWNPAIAILGIVIGLPPLVLSAWAGALADRTSPRRLAEVLVRPQLRLVFAVEWGARRHRRDDGATGHRLRLRGHDRTGDADAADAGPHPDRHTAGRV